MTTARNQVNAVASFVLTAAGLALLVWLVYFVIEATRLLNIWPA